MLQKMFKVHVLPHIHFMENKINGPDWLIQNLFGDAS